VTGGRPDAIDEYVESRPAPALRPLVTLYSGYRSVGVPPAKHRGLPSPYLTMIITLDDPLVVAAHADPRIPPGEYDSLIGGLHSTPALIVHDGRQSGVQLNLTPLGARALLRLPAGELAGADVHAEEVLGPFALALRERVGAASGWPARFAALDEALLRHALPESVLPGEVGWAWHRLLSTRGGVSVSDVAGEVGWSTRHLSQRFRAEIGLGLKEAARVVRFDRARRLLRQPGCPGLAEVAATCGYYDQSHLTRDFGLLAGCPPARWLAEETAPVPVDLELQTVPDV
jgi:AraC-like DNA-binding protein